MLSLQQTELFRTLGRAQSSCSHQNRLTHPYHRTLFPSCRLHSQPLVRAGCERLNRVQFRCSASTSRQQHRQRQRLTIIATTPQPGVEEAPANAPQEWETPIPSKRPDIFPEFEKLKTVLPKPLPGDPEMPDEESEEQAQRGPAPGDPEPEEEGEEGDKEPEKEPEEQPNVPERPKPDLPKIPD